MQHWQPEVKTTEVKACMATYQQRFIQKIRGQKLTVKKLWGGGGGLCVEWGNTNTGWHITVPPRENFAHTCSLELKIIGIMELAFMVLWLNGH